MENISLRSIKLESIKSIFRSISSADSISRATVSEETGLSLMTVGKVADALLTLRVITQVKETKSSAGRRAGLLSVNPDNYAFILDLTSHRFTATVINMRLDVVEKYKYSYRPDASFADNLSIFLGECRIFLSRNFRLDKCIGCGVSVPGPYFEETDHVRCDTSDEWRDIAVGKMVRETLHPSLFCIDASYNAAAMSNISGIPDAREKMILYWFIGDDGICGTIVSRGEIVRGAHNAAGNFGQMIVARGVTLSEAIKPSATMQANAFELAKAIHNVMHAVDPDRIILECEMYRNDPDEFVDMVRSTLSENFAHTSETVPELTSSACKYRHSHRGLTIRLREMWLTDLVLNGPTV